MCFSREGAVQMSSNREMARERLRALMERYAPPKYSLARRLTGAIVAVVSGSVTLTAYFLSGLADYDFKHGNAVLFTLTSLFFEFGTITAITERVRWRWTFAAVTFGMAPLNYVYGLWLGHFPNLVEGGLVAVCEMYVFFVVSGRLAKSDAKREHRELRTRRLNTEK